MTTTVGTWTAVLERIEAALARSLEMAAEPAPAPPPTAEASAPLRPLDERQERLRTCLARAEAEAIAADAVLTAESDGCRGWLEAVAVARQRLTEWAAQAATS
jgi:hypothetical protein